MDGYFGRHDLVFPRSERTYGTLILERGRKGESWVIDNLEPHVAIRLKQIFPRLPKQSVGPFTLPHDFATDTDLRWFVDRYPLRVTEEDQACLIAGHHGFLQQQAAMERILLPDYAPPAYAGLRPGQDVRPYQAQAIEIAYAGQGLLLGDECGLGKTYTAAGFLLKPGVLPAAVVCQQHVQKQWEEVLTAFTTLRVHRIKRASPYPPSSPLPEADVYIFRYSQIGGWPDVFKEGLFKAVVYDEPQELRNGVSTQKGAGAKILSDKAQKRLGLTATPIYNYGSEIFHVMQFINPGVLGTQDDFLREYAHSITNRLKDPKALGTYLREQYAFLRRTKEDVGTQMPPVNRIVDVVGYDEAAVRSVEDVARMLALRATTGSFMERGKAARDLDIMVRQATGVAKAHHVAQIVRIIVEGGEPVLLAGWHRAVYDIWLTELADLKPLMHTGSETPAQKEKAKKAFMAGESNLLITSLRSTAGVDGLQHRCSVVVIGELDYSPGIHHQVIERVDREGQTRPVMALFLVADDGSDPVLMETLGLKASEAHHVVDPTADLQSALSDVSHLRKLVERYLARSGHKPETILDGGALDRIRPLEPQADLFDREAI